MKLAFAASCTLSVLAATAITGARADCDELKAIALPLAGDTTVTLSSGDVHCDNLESGEPQEFVIDGGVLTLTGPSTAAFINVKFTVTDGSGLIFHFDKTEFGPNVDYEIFDSYGESYMLHVMEGAYAEFSGEMAATEVKNYRSVFYNAGTLEFKSDAHFYDCGTNVFRDNVGKLRFRGDAKFERNRYLGINNVGSGTVRINGDSLFDTIGTQFEGADGAAFANEEDAIAIFDGTAVFQNIRSDEDGGAVYNEGKMKFYTRAQFYDNTAGENGGALYNSGSVEFFGAVQMIGNDASYTGGGLAVGGGGSISFGGWATIEDNTATESGGAMSILDADGVGSSVEFEKPTRVHIDGNLKTGSGVGCNNIYLEDASTLIGYESEDDICDESS